MRLPASLRKALVEARHEHGWSQAEVGEKIGLPQMHVSKIETGRVTPRFDTLLDLVRVLDYDLLLVPRELVPVVESLTRDRRKAHLESTEEERPLYASDDDEGETA